MVTNTDIITAEVVDAAYHLHLGLGPGLLESIYERLLAKDLARRGFEADRQRKVSFEYDGLVFDGGLTLDILVNERVAIEVKAVEQIHPVYKRQLFTYLRLLNLEVGLLPNFGAPRMKDGIHRIVHNYHPTSHSRLTINAPNDRRPRTEL